MKFCLKIKILKGKFIQFEEIIKNKTFEVKEKETFVTQRLYVTQKH